MSSIYFESKTTPEIPRKCEFREKLTLILTVDSGRFGAQTIYYLRDNLLFSRVTFDDVTN